MEKYKCYAYDVFDDDNNGFLYGVDWYDNNGNFLDIQWFKEKKTRDNFYTKLK